METKYELNRALREGGVPEALADHVTVKYGELVKANEEIETHALRLQKYTQDTLDELAVNRHIHDWTTSCAADLGKALTDRERAINEVKAAARLLSELGHAGFAVAVRTAAFGSEQ